MKFWTKTGCLVREAAKDDVLFLEQYVLMGKNYLRGPGPA